MIDLKGHRIVWQWQYSAQAEQTPEAVAATLKNYANADVLLVKCMDGFEWQGAYDASSPHNLDEWNAQRNAFAALGVTAIPWVVATNPNDAQLHAQLGDQLVIDLEPYPQFWQGTPEDVGVYLDGLGGVVQTWASIDPRPSAWDALGVDVWASRADGLMPQVYWPDFAGGPFSAPYSTAAWDCLGYVYRCMVAMDSGETVIPALPYNASMTTTVEGNPPAMLQFWRACQGWGAPAPSLWRLGSASAAQLADFGALPV